MIQLNRPCWAQPSLLVLDTGVIFKSTHHLQTEAFSHVKRTSGARRPPALASADVGISSFAFRARYGKQLHIAFAQKALASCGNLTETLNGDWRKRDDRAPSHSTVHALTPLLGIFTLKSPSLHSSLSTKNKVLTPLSRVPKTRTVLSPLAGLGPTLPPGAG